MTNDLYAGEVDANIPVITIDTVGSEITSLVGQIVAFKTATGEIFRGLLSSGTTIENCYRGYYFDDGGAPIVRGNLSNNDTITLMKIGWVFIEDNGSTVDITYKTPSISYVAPGSPATGDYWLDLTNQVWKRYSGVSWEIINRTLVGEVVSDDTNCIATRALDFSNSFKQDNNIEVFVESTEKAASNNTSTRCNVYGTEVLVDLTKLEWNITTDLESPLTEASSTQYFLYLSLAGQSVVATERPYYRADLKGHYHPYQAWRCVGKVYNDSSSDFTEERNYFMYQIFNPNHEVPRSFAAVIANSGSASITSQYPFDFISSVNRSALGRVDITYKTGFFLNQAPSPQATAINSSGGGSKLSSLFSNLTTGVSVVTVEPSIPAVQDFPFTFNVERQGSDYNV